MWTTCGPHLTGECEVPVKCDEFVKSQLLPEAKRLDLSPAASNLVVPQSTHTGGLALNHYKKSHYIFSAKNQSTTQFFLRSILAFLSIMLILFCILFVICLSKPMIHRCYLHAIEAIVGGETIWYNMKHEKTIVFEQELSWRPDLHKAYVDRLSASRIRAAEQCVKLRFFDEQCQMMSDVHKWSQMYTDFLHLGKDKEPKRAKHPGKPHILKSSVSVEAAHSQNLNLRFRRHETCQKLKVCPNKYLLEQLGFSPVWKCITKASDKICWLLAGTCFDIVW